ncbi:hypothetical protein P70_0093 [Listeria phage P70]|uniref:Uncharacterized protein n=1 Tax=Listeria phage P70 TaxID=1225800 RepID=J9QPC8_9CAUD|nr:hypothetical protein P70_0093 [Listeria phage P70]AFQ96282.1 hypothetical protein P70_0093 [Listeria phage P70]
MCNLKPAIPDMYIPAIDGLYMDYYFNESSVALTKIIIGFTHCFESAYIIVGNGDKVHAKFFGDGITLHMGEVVWNG